ncbi:sodium-independent sulfate anion transporter-like isoform X2 [Anastrepha ludens]|uniref:sodium-independent sulfate anion transporter-like isoform X2 n=1 Tax=Anastrepha ludens TaxID=28586 RepID=UPI0023AF5781|nr:sodium-independent sulfate anion transporter-like isoform X2 [Anastrepha ludens]XP_053962365.1 sodium-independent sulfate anion transporter-like isoform X2 [Anastrepha ludens]
MRRQREAWRSFETNDRVGLYEPQDSNIGSTILNSSKKLCRPSIITGKFPILKWLPKYQPTFLLRDAIAGFTVGLTSIPQAIAYGTVAGLQPQYGLYAAFMGCFTYIIFGSCKDITIATTAIMAMMVHDYAVITPDYAVLISFLAGCIILVLGILNLGVLVRFISVPVITGFTMAAACTIGSAQVNNLFGMKSPSTEFIAAWKYLFTHITSIRLNDSLLGVCSLIFLLLLKQVKNIPFGNKIIWKYISLSRNAMVVIFGTFLSYQLSRDGSSPFEITSNITAGLPPFRLPPFSTYVDGKEVYFSEMISTIGSSLASIPLVSILEIVAIAKAFSKGKIVNASQEMIALGMCNIMGSFVSSMPVTGSFTRTAVNNASGVKTPLGGAVTGSMVLIALAFLTQTFYYIPKATLASVIIGAMISLVELKKLRDIWKSKKIDLFPFLLTFLTCLFWSLEYGIICGIIFNITFILYRSARPQIYLEKKRVNDFDVCFVDVKQTLDFASAEYLKEKVVKFMSEYRYDISLVIIKGAEINSIDYTVAMNIISLKEDLEVLKCDLVCWNWNICAAGVICRLNRDLSCMFKNEQSIEEVVNNYYLALQRKNADSSGTLSTNASS